LLTETVKAVKEETDLGLAWGLLQKFEDQIDQMKQTNSRLDLKVSSFITHINSAAIELG
jgi:hypothetical protein